MSGHKGHLEVHTLVGPPEVGMCTMGTEGEMEGMVLLTPEAARKLARSLLEKAAEVERLLTGGTN